MTKAIKHILFLILLIAGLYLIMPWQVNSVQAFEPGKIYDKTNYQEIQDLLVPPMVNWVKKGDFILRAGELECDWVPHPEFIKATEKNKGRYTLQEDGQLIDQTTGEIALWIYGYPFIIDPKDPQAGQKIAENIAANRARFGSSNTTSKLFLIDKDHGADRGLDAESFYYYYQQKPRGQVPNPNGFLQQQLAGLVAPMDLRGMVTMYWIYVDANKQDSAWAYVAMLRRVRRTSAAVKSDPSFGSDFCTDDTQGWYGKNSTMTWKFLGEKTILCNFLSSKKILLGDNPDGSWTRKPQKYRYGFMVEGYPGAKWAPYHEDSFWAPRPVWVVEMFPKDPYYNYGTQLLYVDRDCFGVYYKEIYNRSGEYWKTMFSLAWSLLESPDGSISNPNAGHYSAIDDKTIHGTVSDTIPYGINSLLNLPESKMSHRTFTKAAMMQMSK